MSAFTATPANYIFINNGNINNYAPISGVTLSEKEPIAQFDVPEIPEEYIVHSHKLIIKQISLGPEAKSGEFNVVQVCT